MMDKKQLKKYKSNKRRIAGIKKTIDKLVEQLDNVPVVPGKVKKSGDEFPYIGTNGGFGYKAIKEEMEIALLDSIILAYWACSETKTKKRKQRVSC